MRQKSLYTIDKLFLLIAFFRNVKLSISSQIFSITDFGQDTNLASPPESKGWLRVCDHASGNGSQPFEVEADQCPHGAWLSNPIIAGCVCLNGLWAIGSKWCDEEYSLFLGQGHCFQISKEAQKIAFIGQPLQPFASMNFMTKQNGHVFKPFIDFASVPYEYENEESDNNLNKTILRLLQSKETSPKFFLLELSEQALPLILTLDYFASHSHICVEIQPNSENLFSSIFPSMDSQSLPFLQLYKIRESIKNLRIVDKCPDAVVSYRMNEFKNKMSVTRINVGQGVHVKSGKVLQSTNACDAQCTLEHALNRNKRSSKLKVPADDISEEFAPLFSGPMTDRERLVNEETLRIIRTEVMFILDRQKPPKFANMNWQLLQRAKEAFIKVCPELEVPSFLVNSMFRLFRFLYIHSKDSNPFNHFFEEGPQNLRIAEALDACIKDAEPLDFIYRLKKIEGTCGPKNITDSDDSKNEPRLNETEEDADGGSGKPPKDAIYCTCENELILVNLNYTKNASNPDELFNLTKEQFTLPEAYTYTLIPKSEKFNGSYHDFPIETIWKIVSFTHYYCAKYFKERPADHSAMLMKFEQFFNSDIVHRWLNPGHNTDATWQNLYNAFNLQQFADSVDACVATAKEVSEYPEWIIRPTLDQVRRKKRSLEAQKVSNSGQAYCLQDPWDPVNKLGVKVSDQCYEWNSLL